MILTLILFLIGILGFVFTFIIMTVILSSFSALTSFAGQSQGGGAAGSAKAITFSGLLEFH